MDKLYSAIEEVEGFLKEGKIVELEVQTQLKDKIKSIEDFISENQNITELPEIEKNTLYKSSTDNWNVYIDFLKDIDYNIELTGEEYHYIKDLITKDLHYNETDIFIAFKFKENFLDVVDNLQKINRDTKTYTIKVKIHDFTMLHHLMKNESVKGLGKQAVYFKNVIAAIGKIYKIFNVWNEESKTISDKIFNWTKGLLGEDVADTTHDDRQLIDAEANIEAETK